MCKVRRVHERTGVLCVVVGCFQVQEFCVQLVAVELGNLTVCWGGQAHWLCAIEEHACPSAEMVNSTASSVRCHTLHCYLRFLTAEIGMCGV